jgi:hypothetical protein
LVKGDLVDGSHGVAMKMNYRSGSHAAWSPTRTQIVGTFLLCVLLSACPSGSPTPTPGPTPVVQHGTLQFEAAAYSAAEEAGNATIGVSRIGGSSGAVSVALQVAVGGTAVEGRDFVLTTNVLSFADGEAGSKSFLIAITDDAESEADETIELQLTSPTGGATLGTPGSATATIVDNEPPGYRVGVTVTGLRGSGFLLESNLGEVLAIDTNGDAVFVTLVPEGTPIAVTVARRPTDPYQFCKVIDGAGIMPPMDVLGVAVVCLASGRLDSTFGNGGKMTTDFSGPP